MKLSNKDPQKLSKKYYRFVDAFTRTDFEKDKILGRFYTDFDIAARMMQVLSQQCVWGTVPSELHMIDPFCGDGRLMISLLS